MWFRATILAAALALGLSLPASAEVYFEGISSYFGCITPDVVEQAQMDEDEVRGNEVISAGLQAGVCVGSPIPVPVLVTAVVKDIDSPNQGPLTIIEFVVEPNGQKFYWGVARELGQELREFFKGT